MTKQSQSKAKSQNHLITKQKVLRHLLNLKSTKAPGHDKLPSKIMKDAALTLAEPLTYIINRSLTDSTVPGKLKTAKAYPFLSPGLKHRWITIRLLGK